VVCQRIVARGLAGVALLSVPVAVAALIGFGTSLSGVAGGLSAVTSGSTDTTGGGTGTAPAPTITAPSTPDVSLPGTGSGGAAGETVGTLNDTVNNVLGGVNNTVNGLLGQ
jgi:hypothetical protein